MLENSFAPSDTHSNSAETVASGFALRVIPASEIDDRDVPPAQLPIPADLVDAFADATGWVIGFEETTASYLDRASSESNEPTGGTLKIVDMCANWPAKTPTAHRAKCDRFVESLNRLVQPMLKS